MPLTKLQFRPGINRETTSYTNEGGWFDGDKIRFRAGFPEKIGGWQKKSPLSYLGTARLIFPWTTLDNDTYIGVGTNRKYYIEQGGGLNDITPLRLTARDPLNQIVEVFSVSATAAVGLYDVIQGSTIAVLGVQAFADVGAVAVSTATQEIAAVGSVGSVAVGTSDSGLTVQTNDAVFSVSSVSAFGVVGTASVNVPLTDAVVGITGLEVSASVGLATTGTQTQTNLISFSATSGSSRILVTHPNHGAVVNDFVTLSGVSGLGGNITADVINQEYPIVEVLNTNQYYIEAREAGTSISSITVNGALVPSPVLASALDTGDGGLENILQYQVSAGLDLVVSGVGWGAGTFGRGPWGSASNLAVAQNTLRFWSSDNFGEDLLLNVRDGGLYYWDKTNGFGSRAVSLSDLPGAIAAPTFAKQIMVSDRSRHVLAFGCDGQGSPGVQDPLLIRFSDQESAADWGATATNTAGELRLGSGSGIICAVETRQQIVVFTDTTLYALQYLGPPFTFGSAVVSENITVQGPKVAIAAGDSVFWMGKEGFYVYSGTVQRLPCTVRDYVFSDFNEAQAEQCFAGLNAEDSEVWWFYPSSSALKPDRYVVYSYAEQVWYYGSLSRTAWRDRGIVIYPLAAAPDSHLYYHEVGLDDGSTEPASPISAYVQSSPMDLGDGDQLMFISRIIPDLTFRDATTKTVDLTLDVRNFQNGSYTSSSTQAVDDTTTQLFCRLRGRQMRLKISSDEMGVSWRLGTPRVDLKPDGRR